MGAGVSDFLTLGESAESIAGALASVALLGSVNLAMLLGHWYLVVRGMSIDPLKRLTHATLATALAKILLVIIATFFAPLILRDLFFWMRAGWGLLIPLLLYPMVWGTVRIRSTMAATGILYVEPDKQDFVTQLNIIDEPLATLPLSKVRPGPEVLDQLMDSLR